MHLRECLVIFWNMLQGMIGIDDVERSIGEFHGRGVTVHQPCVTHGLRVKAGVQIYASYFRVQVLRKHCGLDATATPHDEDARAFDTVSFIDHS